MTKLYLPIEINNVYELRDWDCIDPGAEDVINRAIEAGHGEDLFNLIEEFFVEEPDALFLGRDGMLEPNTLNSYIRLRLEEDFPEFFIKK